MHQKAPGDAGRCGPKILAHAAAIIGLYLPAFYTYFSFALFLGLQVNPMYGNIGLLAVGGLIVLYVYLARIAVGLCLALMLVVFGRK